MTPKEEFSKGIKGGWGKDDNVYEDNFIYAWDNGKTNIPAKKGKDIDYATFFLHCPDYSVPVDEAPFFHIEWEHAIKVNSRNYNILSTFLIARYVCILCEIIQSGLKRDYVIREENLHSKVRGRILQKLNTRENILSGHLERFYCSFQEYTEDIPVNRFHKAILLLCRQIIEEQSLSLIVTNGNPLYSAINRCLSGMQNVGIDCNLRGSSRRLQSPHGKLFRNYKSGLELARMIINLQDRKFYGDKSKDVFFLPKFWIYLPTMFEHFVYGCLNQIHDIRIQSQGFLGQRADFAIFSNPKMAIDVKYKDWYKEDFGKSNKTESLLKDYRQLAGYARDKTIFAESSDTDVICIFVYPVFAKKQIRKKDFLFNIFENDSFGDVESINGLTNFYKVGITMPLIEKDNADNKR